MNKIKNVLLWIFSVFMLLSGVVFMGNSVISAVFMFVAGIISNPLFLKKVHINQIINIIACIVLFFAAAILLSGCDTNKTLVTTQSTEESTREKNIEKTTEKENTKSKKELEESSSIAASKRAAKESSVAASKKAAKESSAAVSKAEESRKAAEKSSVAASKAEESRKAAKEESRQASIAQSQAEAAQQASIAQSQAEAAQQASIAQQIPVQNSRYACWVPNGKSYHFTKDCPTLRRSKTILEGSVQNALTAGKTDPCNICAGGR